MDVNDAVSTRQVMPDGEHNISEVTVSGITANLANLANEFLT